MTWTGRVVRKTLHEGSKSEHEGLVLATPEGEFRLRRQGGNPFDDPELRGLEGKQIECEGILRSGQIIMTSWRVTG
jgi:hypothetical protein